MASPPSPTQVPGLFAALGCLSLLAGCLPTLRLTRTVPGSAELGRARTVAVVQLSGPRRAREVAWDVLAEEIPRSGRRPLVDARAQAPAGERLEPGQLAAVGGAEISLAIVVKEFEERRQSVTQSPSRPGQPSGRAEQRIGVATLSVRVFDGEGQLLSEEEVSGAAYGPDARYNTASVASMNLALPEWAVAQATSKFVDRMAPREEELDVPLERDEVLATGVAMARRGDFKGAIAAWEGVAAKDPNHAGAAFNLAVAWERLHAFEKALHWYARAVQLAPARDDFKRMLRDAEGSARSARRTAQ